MRLRRKFTSEEKLQILREAESNGLEVTLRSHNLARSLFYRWRNAFNRQGIDGLHTKYQKVDPEVRQLEKENERLRRVISRMALELEIKDELLKKSQSH
jgi:putative transposase